jgi:hypothetical protein
MGRKTPKIKVVWVRERELPSWISKANEAIAEKLGLDITQKRYKVGLTIGRRMAYGEIIAPDELSAWQSINTTKQYTWDVMHRRDRYDRRK